MKLEPLREERNLVVEGDWVLGYGREVGKLSHVPEELEWEELWRARLHRNGMVNGLLDGFRN